MNKHPEQADDEVFVTNGIPYRRYEWCGDNRTDDEAIGWQTKRWGNRAYDMNGHEITDMGYHPCFAKRAEVGEEMAQQFDDEWSGKA